MIPDEFQKALDRFPGVGSTAEVCPLPGVVSGALEGIPKSAPIQSDVKFIRRSTSPSSTALDLIDSVGGLAGKWLMRQSGLVKVAAGGALVAFLGSGK